MPVVVIILNFKHQFKVQTGLNNLHTMVDVHWAILTHNSTLTIRQSWSWLQHGKVGLAGCKPLPGYGTHTLHGFWSDPSCTATDVHCFLPLSYIQRSASLHSLFLEMSPHTSAPSSVTNGASLNMAVSMVIKGVLKMRPVSSSRLLKAPLLSCERININESVATNGVT